ncbi:hypothetical protein FRC10_001908 [Ceratobasidium sp. 414]|nr:hypothetical protein FRC10_001908 [Ceratobasidium sp. 414]
MLVDHNLLLRFIGMAIGHMTPANALELAVGVSEDTLAIGYEYNEVLEPEEVEPKSADENDGDEDLEEAENDEDEDKSNDGSDAEQYTSGNEDVQIEGDEDKDAGGCVQRKPNPYLTTSTECNGLATLTHQYFIEFYYIAASDTLTFTRKPINIDYAST